ncbi:transglutaminase-like domain-containing protein [Microbacterium sp. W1N]|uniref:transglutaminase-like domain-containing protein n=1 Tax=Microbacterium festucae TaxID=2977531 RepID=UPI0021C08CFB|nr:transglutaminase-like domain-containing protein [Microbacterium festucae]MCT9820633.1 transglutaminase-like domain-containing protein [Microbacterium festucae]
MTGPLPVRRRSRRAERLSPRFLIVGALLLDALFLVGALAVWPLHRDPALLIAIGVALVLAHLIALAGLRWSWNGWWLALVTFAAYVVVGVPVAAPTMLGSMPQLVAALRAVVTAPVTGWKDLLTLELPLGAYQATLAPTFLLFLAVPVAALSLAWRARRLWVLAPLVGLLLPAYGVLFGAGTLRAALRIEGTVLPGLAELLVGAGSILLALAFLVWRTVDERRRAVRAAEAATGIRTTGRSSSALAARSGIAIGMILAAVAVSAVVAPWALADQPRQVLRTAVDPRLTLDRELSPLTQYRAFFTDDRFDEVLFEVQTDADVDRVRLATMSFYDGQVARVTDPTAPGSDQTTAFVRVPSRLPAPIGGEPVSARVEIAGYRGVWVPTVGALTGIDFGGADAAARADGFFYNAATRTGVELSGGGLGTGVSYVQQGATDATGTGLADLTPGREAPQLPAEVVPASLVEWMAAQNAATGGAGLAQLVETLRARGFLSHSLTADGAADWRAALGGAGFEPSRAGHSTGRIDDMFTALLQRQNDVGGDDDALLVAAVGDDEQFAVATAMIADQLGFAARIVLGARLTAGDDAAIPACVDGLCRGGNMTAWVEVQDADGSWTAVDVTPQHTDSVAPEDLQHRDPEVPTEVRPDHADTVLPGEANPADAGPRDAPETADQVDLSALWAALRGGGIAVLALVIVLGPFLLVLLLKALRRRGRRGAGDVVERMTGGWDEFVDTAVDHGRTPPAHHTRQELAALYGDGAHSGAATLATLADRSVFDVAPPPAAEADRFWEIVDAERTRFAAATTRWGRLRARLSLRSLWRRGPRRPRPPAPPRPAAPPAPSEGGPR